MFAELIRARLQALIEAEATEATGARRYQGNGECPVHRNGHRAGDRNVRQIWCSTSTGLVPTWLWGRSHHHPTREAQWRCAGHGTVPNSESNDQNLWMSLGEAA